MSMLLIGIGNEYRSDDGLGPFIAKKVLEKKLPNVVVKTGSGEGAALMESWKGYEDVIIVDAVLSGAKPGTVFRLNASEEPVPVNIFHNSTHIFSVAEAIELARSMKKMPSSIMILGIEGESFKYGSAISPSVKNSVKQVYEEIVRYIIESNRSN